MNAENSHTPDSSDPKRFTPFITYALIGANVAVYLVMTLRGAHYLLPEAGDMLRWGAVNRYLMMHEGEWWRLFTHMFLHFGILHLALNVFALSQIGPVLEWNFGRLRLVFFYVLSGLCGGAAGNWWSADGIAAGASGAIFGLFGALGAYATTNLIRKEFRRSLLQNLGTFVVLNIVLSFSAGNVGGNAGHIGGLIGGILAAYASYPAVRFEKNFTMRALGWLLPLVLTGAFCFLLWTNTRVSDTVELRFREKVERLGVVEKNFVDGMNSISLLPDSAQAAHIRRRALPQTDSIILLSDSIRELGLSEKYDGFYRVYGDLFRARKRYFQALLAQPGNPDSTALQPFMFRIDSLSKALESFQ